MRAGGLGGRASGSGGTSAASTIPNPAPPPEQLSDEAGEDNDALAAPAVSLAEAGSDDGDLLEQLPLAARLAEKQQQRRPAGTVPTARQRSQSPAVVVPAQLAPASGKWHCLSCHP